jgi:hypothetical protein
MAGLDPAIHVDVQDQDSDKWCAEVCANPSARNPAGTWMAGSSPGHDG